MNTGLFDALVDVVTMPVRVALDVVKLPVKIMDGEDDLLENTAKGELTGPKNL